MNGNRHPAALTFIAAGALLLALGLSLLMLAAPGPASGASWCDTSGQSDIPAGECQVLEELYQSTSGDGWTDNNGWLDSPDVCGSWTGITCNGGQVTGIELITNNLTGQLPDSLGSLSALANLDLTANAIEGPIPATLGDLTALSDLSLGGNLLAGEIPAALGRLENLETLDLGDNKLSGTIPAELGDLPNLDLFLFLDGNQLSGKVPDEVCALSPNFANLDFNLLDVTTTDELCDTNFVNWQNTQTVPPGSVYAEEIAEPALNATAAPNVRVGWVPIAYTGDGGGYEVFARSLAGGEVSLLGQTAGKSATTIEVTVDGSPAGYAYFVRTRTDAHGMNKSALTSANSEEVILDAVAITMLGFGARSPVLYLAVLGPLALLLLTAVALLALRKRGTARAEH